MLSTIISSNEVLEGNIYFVHIGFYKSRDNHSIDISAQQAYVQKN